MKQFKSTQLSNEEQSNLLTSCVSPRPVAFVTTIAENKLLNGAPFSYFNIVSSNPPLISIALERDNEAEKDTSKFIRKNKEFVVHIVDESFVEEMDQTARVYEGKGSEVSAVGLIPIQSESINVPGVEEAKIRLECVLEKSFKFKNDAEETTTDLIIGRVKLYQIDEKVLDQNKVQIEKVRPVSRVGTTQYMRIGKLYTVHERE